jgi:hypothetical protein
MFINCMIQHKIILDTNTSIMVVSQSFALYYRVLYSCSLPGSKVDIGLLHQQSISLHNSRPYELLHLQDRDLMMTSRCQDLTESLSVRCLLISSLLTCTSSSGSLAGLIDFSMTWEKAQGSGLICALTSGAMVRIVWMSS